MHLLTVPSFLACYVQCDIASSEQHTTPTEAALDRALPGPGRHQPHYLSREPAPQTDGRRVQDPEVKYLWREE